MKKIKLVLTLCLSMTLGASSQTSTSPKQPNKADTICFTTAEARRVLAAAKDAAGLLSLVKAKEEEVGLLSAQLMNLEEQIKEQAGQRVAQAGQIAELRGKVEPLQAYRATLESEIQALKKEVRKQRRAKVFRTWLGIAGTIAAAILL